MSVELPCVWQLQRTKYSKCGAIRGEARRGTRQKPIEDLALRLRLSFWDPALLWRLGLPPCLRALPVLAAGDAPALALGLAVVCSVMVAAVDPWLT
eukprot:m.887257 g.887257  ORF g.887257 m.887257 type:complete len:96 (-) comp23635_c0_seq15:3291-3578(-)